jgi:DNA-binding transcriptional regulator LsrR (DeoR family)
MDDIVRLLLKVAKLYYEDGITQEMISQRLRISRPKVSRLLQQARDEKIVQITIIPPVGKDYTDLEREVERCFDLKEVVVIEVSDYSSRTSVMRDLGPAAADHFRQIVQDGDLIGLTWGGTLAAMVDALIPQKLKNVRVVQMVGGLGEPSAEVHASDLARRVARAFNGAFSLLPAPGIVDSVKSREILQRDTHIHQSLELATQADIVLAAIGSLAPESLLMEEGTMITHSDIDCLREQGAVGDIGLRFFDIHGNPMETEINQRVIGVDLMTLRSLSRVIGIAGGVDKFEAILGAVRGRFINTLITDQITAKQLLNTASDEPALPLKDTRMPIHI